jgi:hypothetical protein
MSDPTPPVDPRLTPAQLVERLPRYSEAEVGRYPSTEEWVNAAELAAALAVAPSAPDAALRELVDGLVKVAKTEYPVTPFSNYVLDRAQRLQKLAVRPPVAAPDAHYEKNGIRLGDRVVCIDVPRLLGTVIVCTPDAVQVVWDDRTLGDLAWNQAVAYNAYRLQVVHAASVPASPPTREGLSEAERIALASTIAGRIAASSSGEALRANITASLLSFPEMTPTVKILAAPAVSPAPQEGK